QIHRAAGLCLGGFELTGAQQDPSEVFARAALQPPVALLGEGSDGLLLYGARLGEGTEAKEGEAEGVPSARQDVLETHTLRVTARSAGEHHSPGVRAEQPPRVPEIASDHTWGAEIPCLLEAPDRGLAQRATVPPMACKLRSQPLPVEDWPFDR